MKSQLAKFYFAMMEIVISVGSTKVGDVVHKLQNSNNGRFVFFF